MFGLFEKKHKPSITPQDKDWIEDNIAWFIEVFGLDKASQPFIPPTVDNFPYDDLKNPEQFQRLFEQVCKYWDLDPNEIVVKFFDDITSKQWTTWVSNGKTSDPIGLYYKSYSPEEKPFTIELALSNFADHQLLIAVMAHELAHVKLLGGKYVDSNHADIEPLTDLAIIYFGFGILIANSVQRMEMGAIFRSGYLPNEMISYANALMCYITKQTPDRYIPFLNRNTNELFRNDFKFLATTDDTKLTSEKVSEYVHLYGVHQQATIGYRNRNFGEVIDAYNKLLELNPNNSNAFNNIGYALLQQKKYQEAIPYFTKAIGIEPYSHYAYNNRGYCKLQLGDLDNAYADLHTSLDINPDNSYSWRNIGAYYLKLNELDKALRHFLDAEKIDPKTELINFYLGQAYLKMGNTEQANTYLDKSAAQNEHNDSVIE